MAVEAVEPGQRRAGRLRHAQPVAGRAPGMALQHVLGMRPDMAPEQLGVARKPAIGDHDGARAHRKIGAVAPRHDPRATPVDQAQRGGTGSQKHPSLMRFETLFQLCDHQIRTAPLPVLAGHRRAGRRQRPAMPADRAGAGIAGALRCQPIDGARAIFRDRRGELGLRFASGGALDRADELCGSQLYVVVGDMKDPAGPARAAQIALVCALFEDCRAQPQFGAAQRGYQPGKAAADRHQIEFRMLGHHPILVGQN